MGWFNPLHLEALAGLIYEEFKYGMGLLVVSALWERFLPSFLLSLLNKNGKPLRPQELVHAIYSMKEKTSRDFYLHSNEKHDFQLPSRSKKRWMNLFEDSSNATTTVLGLRLVASLLGLAITLPLHYPAMFIPGMLRRIKRDLVIENLSCCQLVRRGVLFPVAVIFLTSWHVLLLFVNFGCVDIVISESKEIMKRLKWVISDIY